MDFVSSNSYRKALEKTSRHESSLSGYFAPRHVIFSVEEELEAALAVETAEVEHWVALLTFRPNAKRVLLKLRGMMREASVDVPVPLPTWDTTDESWAERVRYFAQAIRLVDSDREWMGVAQKRKKHLPQKQRDNVTTTYHKMIAAKTYFAEHNLKLVQKIAFKYRHKTKTDVKDLIQEGHTGLMRAVDRFDHRKGYKFCTYATWWIRHAIGRYIVDRDRMMRIPLHTLEQYHKWWKAHSICLTRLGREPTFEEMAVESGVTAERLEAVREHNISEPTSLNVPYQKDHTADGRVVDLIEYVEDKSQQVDELAGTRLLVEKIEGLWSFLTPIEAAVLKLKYCFTEVTSDKDEPTWVEIGALHSISRDSARKIHERALRKLRDNVDSEEYGVTC